MLTYFVLEMVTAPSILSLLSKRVFEGVDFRSSAQSQEREIVEHLYTTIQNFISCSSYSIENDVTLDYEDQDDKSILNYFSLDYMKKVLDYYDEVDENDNRKHSWRSINHRFKRVSDSTYLSRFHKYVDRNGTKREKLDIIEPFVFSLFENARAKSLVIHDSDLQRWARQKARELSLTNFSASTYWVLCFKRRNSIVSRKITKLITKHSIENEGDIIQSAERFVKEVQLHIRSHGLAPHQVINTDQVGLHKEIHSSRTLSFRGEKITLASVRSKNACTHYYILFSFSPTKQDFQSKQCCSFLFEVRKVVFDTRSLLA